MINKLIRWLNPATGKEHLGPINQDDVTPSRGSRITPAFTTTRRQLDAYDMRKNEQQNVGRAHLLRTGTAYTLYANVFQSPLFDTFDSIPGVLRSWEMRYCLPITANAMAFVCREAGWYNIKGGIDVQISLPAVPNFKITKAEAQLIYSPKGNPHFTTFWQNTQYAPIRVIAGFPETVEQLYLTGWCHTFAEKLYMDCGDMLWLTHKYTGLMDIAYVEKYEARLAIQRTGEPLRSEECCSHG